MYSLHAYQYGFESTWENDHLGKILARYIQQRRYLDPLAKIWICKDNEIVAEVQ